jgi:hypothetical protein
VFNDIFLLTFNVCTLIFTTAYYKFPFITVFVSLTVPFQCLALIGTINVFMKGPILMGYFDKELSGSSIKKPLSGTGYQTGEQVLQTASHAS